MEARRLTQAQAARLFGVTQPKISDLVRGRIDRLGVGNLIEMIGDAGARLTVVGKSRRRVA